MFAFFWAQCSRDIAHLRKESMCTVCTTIRGSPGLEASEADRCGRIRENTSRIVLRRAA